MPIWSTEKLLFAAAISCQITLMQTDPSFAGNAIIVVIKKPSRHFVEVSCTLRSVMLLEPENTSWRSLVGNLINFPPINFPKSDLYISWGKSLLDDSLTGKLHPKAALAIQLVSWWKKVPLSVRRNRNHWIYPDFWMGGYQSLFRKPRQIRTPLIAANSLHC